MNQETKKVQIKCRFCSTETMAIEHIDNRAVALNEIQTFTADIENCKEALNLIDGSDHDEEKKAEMRRECLAEISKREAMIPKLEELVATTEVWEDRPESKPENYDVEDSRCDKCTIEHGSYAEMQYEALSKGLTPEEFSHIMQKTHFKKKGFDAALAKVVEKKMSERPQAELEPDPRMVDAEGNISMVCPVE